MNPTVSFYLKPKIANTLRDGGTHPFFSIAKVAFEEIGCRVKICDDTLPNRHASAEDAGYSLFHNKVSFHPRALDVRRTGIGPFYRMEREPKRGAYRLVDRLFDPSKIDGQKSRQFFRYWEDQLTGDQDKPAGPAHVLIALQGKLATHRSFQTMSPVSMIEAVLKYERTREVVLKLHPKENYSGAEMAAIAQFVRKPNVRLFKGGLDEALMNAAYIITQNSSVVLKGLFHRKPGIVFADCEYHHPFQSIRRRIGLEQAFKNVTIHAPDFEKYAYWYFQLNCINTSRAWAGDTIIEQARDFGWEI